ncbi:MAG TPA: hypothetical protein DHW82_03010 [Spirochaetia bacterium]|nr:MAG: hypothetical protein A2Y41_03635 [Spirochaetes bacterium GWB1_36_13]HCL55961.1 hypothetical protein [Spirochaetia bacterium]
MKHNFKLLLIFALALPFLGACGVAENSLPGVLPKNYFATSTSLNFLQTNKKYQIGDELIITPSLRTLWGIGNEFELSLKTFGLGMGFEVKKQFIGQKYFKLSASGEGAFSFPMMGGLIAKFLPMNQEFLDFVSTAFYFSGAKVSAGLDFENIALVLNTKGGYLNNARFLPDMGTYKKTSYPGLIAQFSLGIFFKTSKESTTAIGIESGFLIPMNLLYFSANYQF